MLVMKSHLKVLSNNECNVQRYLSNTCLITNWDMLLVISLYVEQSFLNMYECLSSPSSETQAHLPLLKQII